MSDGLRSRPYAVANDLATAAKNAAAKLRLGWVGPDFRDMLRFLGNWCVSRRGADA